MVNCEIISFFKYPLPLSVLHRFWVFQLFCVCVCVCVHVCVHVCVCVCVCVKSYSIFRHPWFKNTNRTWNKMPFTCDQVTLRCMTHKNALTWLYPFTNFICDRVVSCPLYIILEACCCHWMLFIFSHFCLGEAIHKDIWHLTISYGEVFSISINTTPTKRMNAQPSVKNMKQLEQHRLGIRWLKKENRLCIFCVSWAM